MSSTCGSRGVLMFVPRSVELRKRGLRRVPGQYNTWIPEAAVEEIEAARKRNVIRQKFTEAMRTDPVLVSLYGGMRWGDIITGSDEARDAPYLTMTPDEFIAVMRSGKLNRTEITRVFKKREEARNRKPIVVPQRSRDADYKYWKKEYSEYGYLYFSSEEQQQAALEELEDKYTQKSNSRFSALLE